MITRRPVFKVFALVSAATVLSALVIHAGCKSPNRPHEAKPEPTSSVGAAETATPAGTAKAASAPKATETAKQDEANLVPPSNIYMGASKSGLVIRPSDVDNAQPKQTANPPAVPTQRPR